MIPLSGRGEAVATGVLAVADQRAQAGAIGLICGTAVNQDGRSSGLTAPNGPAQTALIRTALSMATSAMTDVAVASLHGTGTPLGDPIEVGALGNAMQGGLATAAWPPLALISNKVGPAESLPDLHGIVYGVGRGSDRGLLVLQSCYGHTEGTAGVSGALMALASLSNQRLPPVINLRNMNAYVVSSLEGWGQRNGRVPAVGRQSTQV